MHSVVLGGAEAVMAEAGNDDKHGFFWRGLDAVSKVASIATPLVLGWLSLQLTWNNQIKQSEQATADTVLKVIELSIGDADATENVGLTMISAIEQDGMGGLLDPYVYQKDGFKSLLSKLTDTINGGGSATTAAVAAPTILPPAPPGAVQPGEASGPATSPAGAPPVLAPPASVTEASAPAPWVYLGTWDAAARIWKTKYLEFKKSTAPDDLKNRQFKVPPHVGAVYLRAGPSTDTALEPVIGTLRPGQTVTIDEIEGGSSASHLWARVTL